MQNFIVLGYIPGTQTQLSFTAWALVFSSFVLSTILVLQWRKLRYRVIAFRLTHYIDKYQLA